MERKKLTDDLQLPDAINCSASRDFTQIPNEILRSKELTGKAKAIISILLSNKEGWKSHIESLKNMMKEETSAIKSGLTELEQFGLLLRVRYRDKTTKKLLGSFWAYTDTPHNFKIQEHITLINSRGYEVLLPQVENPQVEKPLVENQLLIIHNSNNTNILPSEEKNSSIKENKITPKLFEKFWYIYPKKIDKGTCLTAWLKICNRKDVPTWDEIKTALLGHISCERWKDKTYIAHPTTWLNQRYWLNDPKEMVAYSKDKEECLSGRRFGKDFDSGLELCRNCEDRHQDIYHRCEVAANKLNKK